MLLDDIATVLDDVAVLTKVATKKTAGVLADDLALNAEQVSGITAKRELPVVWAVAKGSAINKAILVPAALAISALAPWLVTPLLMAGGTFLCYEGFEKVVHKLGTTHDHDARRDALAAALADPVVDLVAFEKDKIKGAIRTDFILSAEIVVITLGTVADAAFGTRVAVLVGIAGLMTVGVYGLVAGIVKLDDAGLYLSRESSRAWVRSVGRGILRLAPWLMKGLAIAGTVAMFLVGGSIIQHGIPALQGMAGIVVAWASTLPGVGPATGVLASLLVSATVGIAAGALALGAVTLFRRLRPAGGRDQED